MSLLSCPIMKIKKIYNKIKTPALFSTALVGVEPLMFGWRLTISARSRNNTGLCMKDRLLYSRQPVAPSLSVYMHSNTIGAQPSSCDVITIARRTEHTSSALRGRTFRIKFKFTLWLWEITQDSFKVRDIRNEHISVF